MLVIAPVAVDIALPSICRCIGSLLELSCLVLSALAFGCNTSELVVDGAGGCADVVLAAFVVAAVTIARGDGCCCCYCCGRLYYSFL